MEGTPDQGADAAYLRSRVGELEEALRLRMDEVVRLERELRHARADAVVRDEYLAVLNAEADKLQRIRDLAARVPFGSSAARLFEDRPPDGGGPKPALTDRVRAHYVVTVRRARATAGRVKRRVLGTEQPGY